MLKEPLHARLRLSPATGVQAERARVLCVDDEVQVLRGLVANLSDTYDVVAVLTGQDALHAVRTQGPFHVVVSDLQMPEMNGTELLAQVRVEAPEVIRILLTGVTDLHPAIEAVNEGQLFRFLTKPCRTTQLIKAVEAGVEQHRLQSAERELLQKTVFGSVETLTEVLALTHPAAFGRAVRLRAGCRELATALDLEDGWKTELAAMLSQIGSVEFAPELMERAYEGAELSEDETKALRNMPSLSKRVLGRIPRLEDVRAIIALQNAPLSPAVPIGARILKVVADFDELEMRLRDAAEALSVMAGKRQTYDADVLAALSHLHGERTREEVVREVSLAALQIGMKLASGVRTQEGTLLIAHGHEVTQTLLHRLHRIGRRQIQEPLYVTERARRPRAKREVC